MPAHWYFGLGIMWIYKSEYSPPGRLMLYKIEQEKKLDKQSRKNSELRMENEKWEARYLDLLKRIEKLEGKQ